MTDAHTFEVHLTSGEQQTVRAFDLGLRDSGEEGVVELVFFDENNDVDVDHCFAIDTVTNIVVMNGDTPG